MRVLTGLLSLLLTLSFTSCNGSSGGGGGSSFKPVVASDLER